MTYFQNREKSERRLETLKTTESTRLGGGAEVAVSSSWTRTALIPEARSNGLAGSQTPGRRAALAAALQGVTACAPSARHSSVLASVGLFESKLNTRVVRVEEMSHLLGGVFCNTRNFYSLKFYFSHSKAVTPQCCAVDCA